MTTVAIILYGIGIFIGACVMFFLTCLGGGIRAKEFWLGLFYIVFWPVVIPYWCIRILAELFFPSIRKEWD